MSSQPPVIQDDPKIIEPALNLVKKSFRQGKTLPIEYRRQQLLSLRRGLVELDKEIVEATRKDLGLDPVNSYSMSVFLVLCELDFALKNLVKWNKPRSVDTSLLLAPSKSMIQPEPLGVALIMGSWNVPFSVTLMPLVSAIAAGDCCIIKPSEMAPYCSKAMKKLFENYLDPDCFRCIEGEIQVAIKITQSPFDIILFTGSTQKGKLVAKAAAERLIPCVLELGGKSPVVIGPEADLKMAVKRTISFRYCNCGQVCLGPDYAYVHESIKEQFLKMATEVAIQFYGEDAQKSSSYSRMINEFHTNRCKSYLEDNHGGRVVFQLGKPDVPDKFFPPTMVENPSKTSLMMSDEIFGPILPVFYYKDISEVIDFVNSGTKPLSIYYFGDSNGRDAKAFCAGTSSGSFTTNDVGMIFAHMHIPFGGVGDSGYGCVRGYHGFRKLVHEKPVILRPRSGIWDFNPSRYPPYTEANAQVLRKAIGIASYSQVDFLKFFFILVLVASIVLAKFFGFF